MVRNCSWCGKPLEFKGGNHKYCNSCRVIARNSSLKKAKKKYNNKKKLQSLIAKGVTNIKSCENCGAHFEVTSPARKYCSTCKINMVKEQWVSNSRKYRKSFKEVRFSDVLRPPPMGTGWLSGNPKSDFESEYKSIKLELNRLGLNHL